MAAYHQARAHSRRTPASLYPRHSRAHSVPCALTDLPVRARLLDGLIRGGDDAWTDNEAGDAGGNGADQGAQIGVPRSRPSLSTDTPLALHSSALLAPPRTQAHFCNLAMCHLKAVPPNWQKARDNCTKALALDPRHVKALFRRGKCNAQLRHLDEAKDDLERVLELQPDNKDAVRELRGLKSQFATQRKKEQKKFAGMFDKLQADDEAEAAATSAAPAEDDDIGEPLGAPQAFEPSDVLYHKDRPEPPVAVQ